MNPDISVVVPVRDREGLVPELLAALDQQTLDHERFEVIIADDSSVDRTPEIAQAWVDSNPSRRQLVLAEGDDEGMPETVGSKLHPRSGLPLRTAIRCPTLTGSRPRCRLFAISVPSHSRER